MKKKKIKTPKARNNTAHASFQSYFDRISHSMEDRLSEYLQMKKYVRVYKESNKLLDIEKTINIAAGSIYEINVSKKVDTEMLKRLLQLLNGKNKALKSFIKGKQPSLQLKLLSQISKNIIIVINNLLQINKHLQKITELIPVMKAILNLVEKEDNYENDPILLEISNILAVNIDEPRLGDIKKILEKEKIDSNQYEAKLNFEDMNDVSDKLIGLLNDKLLVVIGVSEFLIAGVEDDGANDVQADNRLPEELRALFLASSILDILYKVRELKNAIKIIFNSIKLYLQIMNSDKLESQYKALLKNGNNNIHELLSSMLPNTLQRLKKTIIEIVPDLDAFELKLRLDTLDLDSVLRMTYSLIYEKSTRTWGNPYE
ncbi:MAG: hypothetical protein DRQ57_05330 [Gammaproteobacteria bacterium]|nr:MAG: hypothetical protein DRQ57_05330 [Gammaproteobacteria bacterium]